ncbi:hypothetical protein [Streptomyces sp. NPDC088762]
MTDIPRGGAFRNPGANRFRFGRAAEDGAHTGTTESAARATGSVDAPRR